MFSATMYIARQLKYFSKSCLCSKCKGFGQNCKSTLFLPTFVCIILFLNHKVFSNSAICPLCFQEQYIFVHDAVLEYLLCKDAFVKVEEFADKLKSLQEKNLETGNTFVEDEFEVRV